MTITFGELERIKKWMQFLKDEEIIPSHIRVLIYNSNHPLDWIIEALKKDYPMEKEQ